MDNFKHKRPQCYGTYSILCIEKSGWYQLCEKGQEQETKESQFSLSPILISSSSIYLAHFPLAFLDRFFALICANLCPQRSLFSVLNFGSCPTLQMFCMQFLQMYVCDPNPQTTLSNFNSLKPVIKKRQFNAVFTVFQ